MEKGVGIGDVNISDAKPREYPCRVAGKCREALSRINRERMMSACVHACIDSCRAETEQWSTGRPGLLRDKLPQQFTVGVARLTLIRPVNHENFTQFDSKTVLLTGKLFFFLSGYLYTDLLLLY